jgi:hypothetical protein
MINECGAVGGMKIERENQSAQRKPALIPLCPPQILHGMTWVRTQAAVMGMLIKDNSKLLY